MEKFRNKYRIASTRWAAWDYANNAAYFVTLCTAHRAHDFGEIQAGKMIFTRLGQAAVDCWNEIPAHFPFVVLDGFVVMPNHVHGIVVIDKPVGGHVVETHVGTHIETQNFASLPGTQPHNHFGPQSQNLASIMRGYKIGVTKYARQNAIPFAWQARYHDHVIRNPGEHARIWQYIQSNPSNWSGDRFFAPEP